jgi:hypothetical protein
MMLGITGKKTLNMKIEEICRKYDIQNYTINPDGSIDVIDNVKLCNNNLTELPLKFNKVVGEFSCSNNNLTSLDGSPNYIDGDFHCYNNQLENLDGSPNYIGGHFNCWGNKLTYLEGCPNYVGGKFNCFFNPLPKEIIDNPKAEMKRLNREEKLNTLLDEY